MALITLAEAAARHEVPRATLEEWIRLGLLPLQTANNGAPPVAGADQLVDEDAFADLVESMGWLQHSSENLDDEAPRCNFRHLPCP